MADISVDDIQGMVDNTLDLQNKAAQMLGESANRIKVFDPRCEADIQGSEEDAIIWTTKSVELAYDAIKNGYSLKKSPFYHGDLDLRKANLTFQYTQEELEEIIKCKNDIVYFANKYVYLKTPTGMQHIKLRPYQIKLLKQCQDNRFNILLQSRQTGKCSSFNSLVKIRKNGVCHIVPIGSLFKLSTIKQRIIKFLWLIYSKLGENQKYIT